MRRQTDPSSTSLLVDCGAINCQAADESGFAHDMPRTHGYAAKGQRCHGTHDWQARGRTNVIGALLRGALLTTCLFSCNIDSDVFHSWLTMDLIPKLPTGAVLVMDNATFHKRSDSQKAIKNAGHILEFLPPYSPDLNPPLGVCFAYTCRSTDRTQMGSGKSNPQTRKMRSRNAVQET